jgi:hypothetical protein
MKSSHGLAAGLCLLCQCTGTETGNPVHEGDVQIAFAPLRSAIARPGRENVIFESVAIQITSMSLVPCNERGSTVLLEDRSVELVGGDVRSGQIPAGTYCAVIVAVGGDADSFAASRSRVGEEMTVTFESQLRAEVRLELLERFATNGPQASWILGVDLAEWLDPIGTWLDSDGSELSLDAPATLALRQAQARSLRLYEDVNGDGQLDPLDIEAPLSEIGTLLP